MMGKMLAFAGLSAFVAEAAFAPRTLSESAGAFALVAGAAAALYLLAAVVIEMLRMLFEVRELSDR